MKTTTEVNGLRGDKAIDVKKDNARADLFARTHGNFGAYYRGYGLFMYSNSIADRDAKILGWERKLVDELRTGKTLEKIIVERINTMDSLACGTKLVNEKVGVPISAHQGELERKSGIPSAFVRDLTLQAVEKICKAGMTPDEMLEFWFSSVAILLKTKQIYNDNDFGWSFFNARDGVMAIDNGDVDPEILYSAVKLAESLGHTVSFKVAP